MCNPRVAIKTSLECEKGFSLIELMIAIGIFSIGISAIVTMQVSAISGNSGARKIADVLVLAEDNWKTSWHYHTIVPNWTLP